MTNEMLHERGITFSGNYDFNIPYGGCDSLESNMTITGNCLNNNTEIHCVILGLYGNVTSPIANVIVSGK